MAWPTDRTCVLPAVSVVPPVFVTLTCAFRYGREDLDVLGLTFRKDLFMANSQTFPSPPDPEKSLTRLQERLIKKLGEHAHPFTFEVASRRWNHQPAQGYWGAKLAWSRFWEQQNLDQELWLNLGGGPGVVVEALSSSVLILSPTPCLLRFP